MKNDVKNIKSNKTYSEVLCSKKNF